VVLCKLLHCDPWPFPQVSDLEPFGPLVYYSKMSTPLQKGTARCSQPHLLGPRQATRFTTIRMMRSTLKTSQSRPVGSRQATLFTTIRTLESTLKTRQSRSVGHKQATQFTTIKTPGSTLKTFQRRLVGPRQTTRFTTINKACKLVIRTLSCVKKVWKEKIDCKHSV